MYWPGKSTNQRLPDLSLLSGIKKWTLITYRQPAPRVYRKVISSARWPFSRRLFRYREITEGSIEDGLLDRIVVKLNVMRKCRSFFRKKIWQFSWTKTYSITVHCYRTHSACKQYAVIFYNPIKMTQICVSLFCICKHPECSTYHV